MLHDVGGVEIVEPPNGTSGIDEFLMKFGHESVVDIAAEHFLPLFVELCHDDED